MENENNNVTTEAGNIESGGNIIPTTGGNPENENDGNGNKPNTSSSTATDGNSPYETIIAQKDAQINALIEQTNKLTEQITNFINSGTQLNDGKVNPAPTPNVQPLEKIVNDDSMSLEALGREIGKPRKD